MMTIEPGTPCDRCGEPLALNKWSKYRTTRTCKPCLFLGVQKSSKKIEAARAAAHKKWADPAYREKHRRVSSENRRRRMAEDPQFAEWLREMGRELAKRSHEASLAWCPIEYRDEYRRLKRAYHLRAPEARRMIEEQIAKDLAAYQATGQLQQSVRS